MPAFLNRMLGKSPPKNDAGRQSERSFAGRRSQVDDQARSQLHPTQSKLGDQTKSEHRAQDPHDSQAEVLSGTGNVQGNDTAVVDLGPSGSENDAALSKSERKGGGQSRTSSYQTSDVVRGTETEETSGFLSLEHLRENDIVIAVMGPTGTGKSTFIRSASGRKTEGVGDGLKSYTSEVRPIRFHDEESGQVVVLVDTPGFDDTYRSDLDILNMISDWLSSSYKKHKLLSGILYLHRITDNRMAGTPLKNLRVFRKLCGRDALDKVYLTTTMWDEVEESVGEERLTELRSVYWKTMISQGASVVSCKDIDESPKSLIRDILKKEGSRRVRLQEEMVEMQLEIKETEAGQELYSYLEAMVQKQTEVLQKIGEARKGAKDDKFVSGLEKEYAELQAKMDEKIDEMEKLKLPRMKRVLKALLRSFWNR